MSWLDKYVTFFKAHEKLVIIVITSLFMALSTKQVIDYLTARDQKIYDKQLAVLQSDRDKNAALAQQGQQISQEYAAIVKQVEADRARLEAQITQRDTAVKQQQAVDAQLPPPALASRWETVATLPVGSISLIPNGYSITDSAARTTVQSLEQVSALKEDLNAVHQELDGKVEQLSKQSDQVANLQGQVAGKDKQLTDADKACKDQIKTVKDQARKGKVKWFVIGYVAGLITKPLAAGLGL